MSDIDREPVPGDISVNLTFPSFFGGSIAERERDSNERAVHIEISDGPSRGRIVDFYLSAAQFTDLMRGGNVRVQGAWLPTGEAAARLGRTQRTATTELHSAAVDNLDDAARRVTVDYLAAGWETVDARKTNYGRLVVARRWDAPE